MCPHPQQAEGREGGMQAALLPRRLDGAGEQSWHRGEQLNLAPFPARSELRRWAPAGRGATVSAVHLSSGFTAPLPPGPPPSSTACHPTQPRTLLGPRELGWERGFVSVLDDATPVGTSECGGECDPTAWPRVAVATCNHGGEGEVLAWGHEFLQGEMTAGEMVAVGGWFLRGGGSLQEGWSLWRKMICTGEMAPRGEVAVAGKMVVQGPQFLPGRWLLPGRCPLAGVVMAAGKRLVQGRCFLQGQWWQQGGWLLQGAEWCRGEGCCRADGFSQQQGWARTCPSHACPPRGHCDTSQG